MPGGALPSFPGESARRSGLNVQPLRAFCYVARLGSITRAAEALDLDQSTVSLHIKTVERSFDTVLFVRSGRGIRLTSDGAVLLKLLAPLIDAIDRLPTAFAELRDPASEGTYLRIAAVESVLLHVLPRLIARYREACPHVHIDLIHAPSGSAVEMVREGQAELGFVIELDIPAGLHYQAWFECPMLLLAQPGHPLAQLERISLTDIARYPLVLSTKRYRTRSVIDSVFDRHGIRPLNIVETAGPESIKRCVRLGLGVSVLPLVAVPESTEELEILPVDHLFGPQRYGIVSRPGKLSSAAQRFLDILANLDPYNRS